MKVEKTFYVLKKKGTKYFVPDKNPQKITSRTPTVLGQLSALLADNSDPKAKKMTVTIES